MTIENLEYYFKRQKSRYKSATKNEKQRILDDYELNTGLNRKYIIRLFNEREKKASQIRPGRRNRYGNPELLKILKRIWKLTNLPCSKRLRIIIPLWLSSYESHYGKISDEIKDQLKSISARTIDRILKGIRNKYKKRGLCTTKPGTLLKSQIPVKTNQWNEDKPGFLEADTVGHCGSSTEGSFVYTLNMVDINTQWTIQSAIWGKGSTGVLNSIKNAERALPFKVLGFDCDNGSEFLNYPILRYFKKKKKFQFTRSREYKKNDNAHIESKNWSIIRQYFGYQRFDDPRIVGLLNDLYSNEFYLFINFFIPTFKLKLKIRQGSKIIKQYDKPKTPYQRILESPFISRTVKSSLRKTYSNLDPISLQKEITIKINKILDLAKPLNNSAGI